MPDGVIWLRERTVLGILPTRVLRAIPHLMEDRVAPANQQLAQAGAPVKELYILRQGRIQGDRTRRQSVDPHCRLLITPPNQSAIAYFLTV